VPGGTGEPPSATEKLHQQASATTTQAVEEGKHDVAAAKAAGESYLEQATVLASNALQTAQVLCSHSCFDHVLIHFIRDTCQFPSRTIYRPPSVVKPINQPLNPLQAQPRARVSRQLKNILHQHKQPYSRIWKLQPAQHNPISKELPIRHRTTCLLRQNLTLRNISLLLRKPMERQHHLRVSLLPARLSRQVSIRSIQPIHRLVRLGPRRSQVWMKTQRNLHEYGYWDYGYYTGHFCLLYDRVI
jgi:hypothetical protein